MFAKLDIRRQLNYHERVINELAYRSAKPEIDSDVSVLKRSLQFVAEHGSDASEKTARSLSKIFALSEEEDIRSMCLAGLYQIDDSAAKNQLLAMYRNVNIDERWRTICANYLKRALEEGQRISARDATAIAGITVASGN